MNSNSLKARQDNRKIIPARFPLAAEKLKIIQLTGVKKQHLIAIISSGLSTMAQQGDYKEADRAIESS